MAYPQTPWTLQGYAIATLQLVDVERSRPFIPPEFDIVSVWPGKTLGGVYLSDYRSGSVLEYSELIVVSALVSHAGKFGSWVSHIYVDNADSVAGGREIWGLPKELAEFTWTQGEQSSVAVCQGDRRLCSLTYTQQGFGWRQPLSGTSFSALDSHLLFFKSGFDSRVGLVRGKLEVPAESPFSQLDLGQPWLTVYCDQMRLVVDAPKIVGQRTASEFSYR